MRKRITRQKITLLITMLATSFVALAQSDLPVKVEMKGSKGTIIVGEAIASFNNPWAMAFLPDGPVLPTLPREGRAV